MLGKLSAAVEEASKCTTRRGEEGCSKEEILFFFEKLFQILHPFRDTSQFTPKGRQGWGATSITVTFFHKVATRKRDLTLNKNVPPYLIANRAYGSRRATQIPFPKGRICTGMVDGVQHGPLSGPGSGCF